MTSKYKYITIDMNVPLDDVIEFIRDDSRNYNRVEEALQIQAVIAYPPCLEYMANPSKKVQEAAVRSQPSSIGRIRKPSVEIQLLATSLQPNVVKHFLVNPCKEAKSLAALLA